MKLPAHENSEDSHSETGEDVINTYRAVTDFMSAAGQDAPPSQMDVAILAAAGQRARPAPRLFWRYAAIAAGIACLCLAAADAWRADRPAGASAAALRSLPALQLTAAAQSLSRIYAGANRAAVNRVDSPRGTLLTVSHSQPDPSLQTSASLQTAPPDQPGLRTAAASEGAARGQDFSALVQALGPAVVTVVVERQKADTSGEGGVQWSTAAAGFIVTPDGTILTHAHVVSGAARISVRLLDRHEYTAQLIGTDVGSGVAVIKIPAQDVPAVEVSDSRRLRVGDWVVALGAPASGGTSAAAGIVSAKAAVLPGYPGIAFIQADVPVTPGSPGGPLVDMSGKVVGINSSAGMRSGDPHRTSYAIPIELAMRIMVQLKSTSGLLPVTLTAREPAGHHQAQEFVLPAPDRGRFLPVEEQQPPLLSPLPVEAASCPPRAGAAAAGCAPQMLTLTESPAVLHTGTGPAELGLDLRPVTAADEQEGPATQAGLAVEGVRGAAADAGILRGDVVLAVNGSPVASVAELRAALSGSAGHAALLIQRGGAQLFLPVQAR